MTIDFLLYYFLASAAFIYITYIKEIIVYNCANYFVILLIFYGNYFVATFNIYRYFFVLFKLMVYHNSKKLIKITLDYKVYITLIFNIINTFNIKLLV